MQYEWHEASGCGNFGPIVQVHGVCFDESGNVMVIREPGKDWHLVGGKPELEESFEETLRREVGEETNVTLRSCGMIGYQKVTRDDGSTVYQLRFAATIKEIGALRADPTTGKINERAFVSTGKISEWIAYEEITPIVEAALTWYGQNQYRSECDNMDPICFSKK